MIHSPDVFYDIQRLSLKRQESLLREAKEKSFHWWVDTLDCKKSYQRQTVQMSFEDVMKLLPGSLCVFIHRRGFENWKWYLETGFRTMTSPEHFLWINSDQKEIEGLVKKYKLKVLQ